MPNSATLGQTWEFQICLKTYYNPQFLGPKLLFGQQIFLGSIFGALDLFRHKSFMPKFFRTQIFLDKHLFDPKFGSSKIHFTWKYFEKNFLGHNFWIKNLSDLKFALKSNRWFMKYLNFGVHYDQIENFYFELKCGPTSVLLVFAFTNSFDDKLVKVGQWHMNAYL